MVRESFFRHSMLSIALFSICIPAGEACTTVLVGKAATVDGSTMIARNEDMKTAWDKRFVVHPEGQNTPNSMYVSKGNGFTYPLPLVHYKYTATPEWTQKDGQYEEAGINQFGVAMSATESARANEKALKADPLVKNGIAEDSMLTVVLPYVKTAREGVERLGKIVEQKGAAEVNGVIFSDKNEIWYMEIGSGHHWVAVRVPDNSYAVIPNKLCIGEINLDDSQHYLASPGLIVFAEQKGLYNPKKDGNFSFKKAFGTEDAHDKQYNNPRIWDGQRILTPSVKQDVDAKQFKIFQVPDKKIAVTDVAKVLRSHFNNTPYDPYGRYQGKFRPINVAYTMESHILQCRPNMPSAVGCVHWISLGVPETSVFIPFYSGILSTPQVYQQGTDMPDFKSAYWTYRRTGALTTPYYHPYMEKYTQPQLEKIRQQVRDTFKNNDQEVLAMYQKNPKQAEIYMTEEGKKLSATALQAVQQLNAILLKQMTAQTPVQHDSNL